MSFLVEDGTGLSASNSYASVAEYKAYCTDRGMSFAGVSDATIQQNLVKSTDYIDQRFGDQFVEEPETAEQALEWPRDGVWLDEGLPIKLKYATIEYAFRVQTSPLWNVPTVNTTGVVSQETKKVGPIEKSVSYSSSASTIAAYPPADKYLRSLLNGTGSQATSYR